MPDHWSNPSSLVQPQIIGPTPDHWSSPSSLVQPQIIGPTPDHWSNPRSLVQPQFLSPTPDHWSSPTSLLQPQISVPSPDQFSNPCIFDTKKGTKEPNCSGPIKHNKLNYRPILFILMPFHARAIGEKEDRGGGGERGVKGFRILSVAYKKERKHELNGAPVVFLGPASECLSTELV